MTNLNQDTNFDPLKHQAKLETRTKAAGLTGKKSTDIPEWEQMVRKRPHVNTLKGQAVDIASNTDFGMVHVNLEWSEPKPKNIVETLKSLIGLRKAIDLDLGCLYELADGTRGAIQAFGDEYGDFSNAPYVHLQGDDRTGVTKGEDIYLNGDNWDKFRRVVFYAYIYKGVPTWSQTDALLTILMKDQDPVDIKLKECQDGLPVCAIVKIVNQDGHMVVTNLNEYYPGHAEMERAFGFGLNWEEGSKDD